MVSSAALFDAISDFFGVYFKSWTSVVDILLVAFVIYWVFILIRGTRAADRGVQQAPFFVLSGVECPAVLVEVGYISHPQEGAKLGRAEYQEKLAEAIADGVDELCG